MTSRSRYPAPHKRGLYWATIDLAGMLTNTVVSVVPFKVKGEDHKEFMVAYAPGFKGPVQVHRWGPEAKCSDRRWLRAYAS